MYPLLEKHKVLICAGSGGVGKTTISAALGVFAARQGMKVLVLTIDPARRLATALGLKKLGSVDSEIPLKNCKGQLFVSMIDSKYIFDEFVKNAAPDVETGQRLLNNRLYGKLSTTLSGSQEYTSLEKLYSSLQSKAYDLIILDTPPTKHAMDFLKAPYKIHALFQDSIVKWFTSQQMKEPGFFRGLLQQGTLKALKLLEIITGEGFVDELIDFFGAVKSWQPKLRDNSLAIHKMLTSKETGFVLVTSFDESKIEEARSFYRDLKQDGFHLAGVIINRSLPEWMMVAGEGSVEKEDVKLKKISLYMNGLKQFYHRQQKAYDRLQKEVTRSSDEIQFLRIKDFDQDISDVQGLEKLAECLGG